MGQMLLSLRISENIYQVFYVSKGLLELVPM